VTTGGLDAVAVFQQYLAGNGGIHLTSKVLARLDWVLKLHLTKTGRSWHGYHFQDGRLRFTPNIGAVSPDFEVFALLHAVADFVRRCPRCATVFLAEGRRRYCSSLCAVTGRRALRRTRRRVGRPASTRHGQLCAYPPCSRRFEATGRGQRYCSAVHGTRHRAMRQRERRATALRGPATGPVTRNQEPQVPG
jgi:hypothetical protein